MRKFDLDVAILGAGTAGLAAYREARKYTDRLAVFDGGELGTTCARVGCMPSKLLIAAGHFALAPERAPRLQVRQVPAMTRAAYSLIDALLRPMRTPSR